MRFLSWPEVCKRRLSRQHLLKPAPLTDIAQVVGDLCGVQAQIITAAELATCARVEGSTQDDIRKALWHDRTLVKTYGPRNTLHLFPSDELPFWMAAMRARALIHQPQWHEAAGLNPTQAESLLSAIGQALDGKCLTREELAAQVSERLGPWAKERLSSTWGELLTPAAYAGLLCFGPSQGSKVTFVRADQWINHWKEIDPTRALKEATRRYLAAYGPATHRDVGHWFWLKPDPARHLLESLGDEIEQVEFEGRQAWVLTNDAEAEQTPGHKAPAVRLLPQYDTCVLGNGPRDRIVPETARKRIFSYGRGRFEGAVGLPVLLIDGVVAGIWDRKTRAKSVEIRVESFTQLTPHQQTQLELEAHRIGHVLDLQPTLTTANLD